MFAPDRGQRFVISPVEMAYAARDARWGSMVDPANDATLDVATIEIYLAAVTGYDILEQKRRVA